MKKHTIFDNYDVSAAYSYALENLIENEIYDDIEEVPESAVWDEVYEMENINWDDARREMEQFFDGKMLLVGGSVGRWDGTYAAGKVIKYEDLWKCWQDCDYISIYDQGGHFHIEASHHDGTNHFEVKILTEKGAELYDRWDYDWTIWQNCSEREVHEKLWKNTKYSHIPHFARDVYGCKTR